MPIEYLKKATPPQEAIDNVTSETVQRLLADIQINGCEAVEKYARDFDGWHGSIVVSEVDFANASKRLSQALFNDRRRLRFDRKNRRDLQPARYYGDVIAGSTLILISNHKRKHA